MVWWSPRVFCGLLRLEGMTELGHLLGDAHMMASKSPLGGVGDWAGGKVHCVSVYVLFSAMRFFLCGNRFVSKRERNAV